MNKTSLKNLPPKFIRNITGLYRTEGQKWIENLPDIIGEINQKWSLQIKKIFPNLSFNFVAACVDADGAARVLKVGFPEKGSSIIYEKRALEAFDGKGAVRIIKFDENLYAMLLEQAVEGKTLDKICGEDYEKAVKIAIDVMQRLPRRPLNKKKFINLESWIKVLNRAIKAKFELEKVRKAKKYFGELVEPFEKKILLHGDIHFDNILSAGREPFLVIDPKGLVGEIGYEIAVFLNDLAGWTDHLANREVILNSAIESFAKAFNINSENLRKWAFSFAVLSAWWMVEDFGENRENHILRAEIWKV